MDSDKKRVLEELEKSHGVVAVACNNAGIARSTFYNWKEDSEFRAAVEDINEAAIDHVESKLFERIDGGDTASTIFYLKTKGKKRGYVERNELSGPDGETFVLNFQTVPPGVRNYETKTSGGIATKAGVV